MSTSPSTERAAGVNRRTHPRRRLESLTYVRFDEDNGGILIDISEGGLNFQGVAGVTTGESCIVKCKLPGVAWRIETPGQIVWSNSSKKGGGVRFVDPPEDLRLLIRRWISQGATHTSADRPGSSQPRQAESAAGPKLTVNRLDAAVSALTDPATAPRPGGPESSLHLPLSAEAVVARIAADRDSPRPIDRVGAAPVQPGALPLELNIRGRGSEPRASAHPAVFPRSELLLKDELDRYGAQGESSKLSESAAQTLVIVALACVMIVAVIVGVSRYPAIVASFEGKPQAVAAPSAAPMQSFKVDVVDLNNRRLTLENADGATSAQSNAGVRRGDAAGRATADAVESPAIPQDLSLGRPHSSQSSVSQAGVDAPPVAENTPLSAIAFDPRTPAPSAPPPEPAPAPAFVDANSPSANPAGGFRQAVVIHIVQPEYSRQALREHVGGDVRVTALVDKYGVPRYPKIISGDKRLAAAALAAVKQWRYDPAQLNGEPVESSVVVTVSFQAQ